MESSGSFQEKEETSVIEAERMMEKAIVDEIRELKEGPKK